MRYNILLVCFTIFTILIACNKEPDKSELIQPYIHCSIGDTLFIAGAIGTNQVGDILRVNGWYDGKKVLTLKMPSEQTTGDYEITEENAFGVEIVRFEHGEGYLTSGMINVNAYNNDSIQGRFNGSGIYITLQEDTLPLEIHDAEFLYNFL